MSGGRGPSDSEREGLLRWMDRWVDPLLIFLAATSIPLLIIDTGDPSPGDMRVITWASWLIWGAFTVNFVARLAIAPDRRSQFRLLAWDLILIVGQPLYTVGPNQAGPGFALLRLAVILGRSLHKGRVLRRLGRKLRTEPLRVVAFLVPFLWLTGGALVFRLETESGVVGSPGDGLWWSAVTMATVGYGDISPKTTWGRAVAIMVMVVGIGMFSLVTAKLAELLFIARTRGSRRTVGDVGHTLVLGWSPKVFTIVEQLVLANASRPHATILVLAERDHNDMFDDIVDHVPALARSTTTLVTRQGSPSDPADLAGCRPEKARSIIVIDDTDADASVVRTVLALINGGADLPPIPVVAEIDDEATAAALQLALGDRITVVNPTTFIARTAAQACRSAGIALAYRELLGFEGGALYSCAPPAAVGHRVGDLLNGFSDACLIGLRHDGGTDLAPPLDAVVGPGDELIVLAEDDSRITFVGPVAGPVVDPAPTSATLPGEHVVVFGWNDLGPHIIRELDGYVPAGSQVTVAVDDRRSPEIDDAPLAATLTNSTLTVRRAEAVAYADLVELIAEEHADHAVILCYRDRLSVAEADAHALVTTLQVRRALEVRGRDTTVVTELLDQRDVALAPPRAAGDFIVSDRLISLLLTQLAENADLADVFDDLLDADGAELYCKSAERYCTPGTPTTFAELIDAAGRRGEMAIGYRRREANPMAGPAASLDFDTVMNPPRGEPLVLQLHDQLIVVADR